MNQLARISTAALLLTACATGAQAQCVAWGTYSALTYIDRPHPQENLFPYGGWTLYPGEAGSGVPAYTPYAPLNNLPPRLAAARVEERLHHLGIPRHVPQPHYLGRNPAIADNVQLPTPRSWLPKTEEEEERERNKDKLDPEPPPSRPKAKDKDKDKGNGNREPLDQPKNDP